MNRTLEVTGGARIGWMNAGWPFATLTATADSLRVKIRIFGGDYTFTPASVVAITRDRSLFSRGIRIEHGVAEYPAHIVFWCFGDPETLLARIHDTGFEPLAPATAMPERRGLALRWSAIVAALLVWNGLLIADTFFQSRFPPVPGFISLVAIGLFLVVTIVAICSPAFQRLLLKPGRHIGEIRAMLNFFVVILGFMFVVFSILRITGVLRNPPAAVKGTTVKSIGK